jgi:hypothetical protein
VERRDPARFVPRALLEHVLSLEHLDVARRPEQPPHVDVRDRERRPGRLRLIVLEPHHQDGIPRPDQRHEVRRVALLRLRRHGDQRGAIVRRGDRPQQLGRHGEEVGLPDRDAAAVPAIEPGLGRAHRRHAATLEVRVHRLAGDLDADDGMARARQPRHVVRLAAEGHEDAARLAQAITVFRQRRVHLGLMKTGLTFLPALDPVRGVHSHLTIA